MLAVSVVPITFVFRALWEGGGPDSRARPRCLGPRDEMNPVCSIPPAFSEHRPWGGCRFPHPIPRPALAWYRPHRGVPCPIQEMKVAQRMAQKSAAVPELWARCLLGHCYGLWFLCLPAYVRSAPSRVQALHTAYQVLRQMESRKVVLPDEVGIHAHPQGGP